jgi:transposase-like protein
MVAIHDSLTSTVHAGRMNDETDPPDPEVPERAKRRRFTAEYKARILAEYESASTTERGELLRREGLYSSHVSEWRKAASRGATEALAGKKRGRKGPDAKDRRIARLEVENDRLRDELGKAQLVIDVQGKVSALLGDLSKSAEDEQRSTP